MVGQAARDARARVEGPEVAAPPVGLHHVHRDPAAIGRDLQQAESAGLADRGRLAADPVEPGEAGGGGPRLVASVVPSAETAKDAEPLGPNHRTSRATVTASPVGLRLRASKGSATSVPARTHRTWPEPE